MQPLSSMNRAKLKYHEKLSHPKLLCTPKIMILILNSKLEVGQGQLQLESCPRQDDMALISIRKMVLQEPSALPRSRQMPSCPTNERSQWESLYPVNGSHILWASIHCWQPMYQNHQNTKEIIQFTFQASQRKQTLKKKRLNVQRLFWQIWF